MGGKQGSAVVVDVESGKLVASSRIDTGARRLAARIGAQTINFSALIDANIVQSSTRHPCARTLRIQGRNLDCSQVAAVEPFDAVNALAYSCNNYFARASTLTHFRRPDRGNGIRYGKTRDTAFRPRCVRKSSKRGMPITRNDLVRAGENRRFV